MAAESIRGDGLFQAHEALAALAEDPEQFESAMERRFNKSPPLALYRSRSGTPTRPESPIPENDPLRQYTKHKNQLYMDWMSSTAANQFMTQHREELRRIERAGEFAGVGRSPAHLADDRVRERWIEQGIWDPKWYESNLERWGEGVLNTPLLDALWLHEAPPEDDNSDTDEEHSSTNIILGPRRQKTEEEARQSAERRAERRRRREVTRPIHQFNYQVSRERERLLEELERAKEAAGDDAVQQRCPPDICTQAYTIVKDRWVERRIWVEKWGILPGMTWLHERDMEELALEELGPRPPRRETAVASSADVRADPPIFPLGSPEELP